MNTPHSTPREQTREGQTALPKPFTPLPWMIFTDENGDYLIQAEYGPHGEVATIARQYPQDDGQRSERAEAANVNFIFNACMAHDRLARRCAALENALERIVAFSERTAHCSLKDLGDVARAALKPTP